MAKNAVVNRIGGTINKITFQLKKHSPEILIVAGVVGTVASAVLACKATLKAPDILENAKEDIDKIHERIEHGCTEAGQEYTEADSKKELASVYLKTGVEFGKLYAPAVALGTLSVASIITSNNIHRRRNVALAAAYATVDKSFKEYRGRVIDKFGEEVDRQLKYNIQSKEVEETVTNEKGKEKTVKVVKQYINPEDISGYARFFEEYTRDEKGNVIKNPNWEPNNEYNLMFLKAQQKYANDLLIARHGKPVFLNEVYDMVGLPRSQAGQIVGWVYDPEAGRGDNYIDFGIFANSASFSDYIYGNDPAILLDFNVDGNVWDLMK